MPLEQVQVRLACEVRKSSYLLGMFPKLLTLISFALLCSCGKGKKEEVVPPKRSRIVIGEVTSVHSEQGFVLFRRYGPGNLITEGLMSSRSLDGRRAASLRLSPEKMGRFYTADYSVEADAPRVGDLVMLSKGVDDTQSDTFSDEDETALEQDT